MSLNLSLLDKMVSSRSKKPSIFQSAQFLFFQNGIGTKEFCSYPIPYIVSMLNAFDYYEKEKEKAYKKAKRK